MCHHRRLIVTIVAVAIPLLQLVNHCVVATLLPSPSSVPQSYHAIVVAVTLPQLPYHRCCHFCSRRTIVVAIFAVAVPSLSPLCHHRHSCHAIIALSCHRNCHSIVMAITMPSLSPSQSTGCHCVAITKFAMPSLQSPSHRLIILIVVVMSLMCHHIVATVVGNALPFPLHCHCCC